jgi:hypothetical protein
MMTLKEQLKADFELFAKKQLVIRSKEGQLIPFNFNKAQLYLQSRIKNQLSRTGKVRLAVLKGRQQGLSTFIGGYLYHRTITRKGTLTFIFAHDSDGSGSLYKMVQTYYHEGVYDDLKPNLGAASQKEMSFPLINSSYKVGTAGTSGLGRSKTIQQLHWSEVAYSPNCEDHAMGIMQAVPDLDGTAIFLESTSNGQGDFFHRTCMQALSGKGDFELVFIPWYWQEEYKRKDDDYALDEEEREYLHLFEKDGLTKEHLIWRKHKITNDFHGQIALFKREYPFTPQEAFEANDEEAFIKSGWVRRARDAKPVSTEAPMIFGVDPARLGGDRFVICRRRGRNILDIKTLPASELEQSTQLLMQEINKYNPAIVNIDAGGLGVAVYDRLRAIGFGGIARKVDFGGSATNSDKFKNKRAEMYSTLRDWLQDEPCHIGLTMQDADKLQSELAVVKAKWINNSQMVMIPKEDIKKELGYSPDYADACALTFAQPIAKTATDAGMRHLTTAVTKPVQWSVF